MAPRWFAARSVSEELYASAMCHRQWPSNLHFSMHTHRGVTADSAFSDGAYRQNVSYFRVELRSGSSCVVCVRPLPPRGWEFMPHAPADGAWKRGVSEYATKGHSHKPWL